MGEVEHLCYLRLIRDILSYEDVITNIDEARLKNKIFPLNYIDIKLIWFQPAFVAEHLAHLLGVWQVMGSILCINCVIAKDVKSCTAAMSDARH